MATRLPASERTREELRDLIAGRLTSGDERSALLRLATRLIVEEALEAEVADALLAPSGKKLKDLQTGLDTENPHAEGGFVLPKVRVAMGLGLEHIKKADSPLECTVTYSPTMASSAISLARLVAQGRKMSELAELAVPKLIVLQSETITKANVDQYLPLGFKS